MSAPASGTDAESLRLSQALLEAARKAGVSIATAESCTGGMVAASITTPPGASDIFGAGFVTYANKAKTEMLGVHAETLTSFGAVSEEVAKEMAQGASMRAGSDIAVSITGIAGPGGSEFKPEGRVCFGVCVRGVTRTETVEFGAIGRDAVRKAACQHALGMVLNAVKAGDLP